MDALLPAFIAVLLAETGGSVQALTAATRERRPAPVTLIALALSTLVSLGLAAWGATLIAGMIGLSPRTMLAGLALLFAGAPMLLPKKLLAPQVGSAFFAFLAAQIGDASQFVVFALAARTNMPLLALAGGCAAVMFAAALPLMARADWPDEGTLNRLRRIPAILLLLAGLLLILRGMGMI